MRRILVLLFLALPGVAQEEHARALARIRALEAEIAELVERLAPTVGAVVNHATQFDPKTGRVTMRPRGQGSGVLISGDGFFLTNVHVVAGSGYVTVALPDGVTYRAERYADTGGGKAKGDIAVLKLIGKRKFPHVDWRRGSAERLTPGSFAFAMGNPYGHAADGTPVVTMGVISGTGRAASNSGYLYLNAVQTDAEINPGNSGGPLFDMRGMLVGINGLARRRADGFGTGIGFAIPIDQVRLFLRDLLRSEGETIGYGFHGLEVESAPKGKGVFVKRIAAGSPGARSLERGDLITRVNGKRITDRAAFLNTIGQLPEETEVRIQYRRRDAWKRTRFRLVSYAEYLEQQGRGRKHQPLPLHERGYLAVEWQQGRAGVHVTRVVPGTSAEAAGLQAGDRLVAVGEREAQTAAKLVETLSFLAAGAEVELAYERAGKPRQVRLVLSTAAEAAGLSE